MVGLRVLTDTFWTNPQFRVTVIDADEDDDDDTGSLIIALLQRERRSVGSELLTIGYAIYKVGMRLSCNLTNVYRKLVNAFQTFTRSMAANSNLRQSDTDGQTNGQT